MSSPLEARAPTAAPGTAVSAGVSIVVPCRDEEAHVERLLEAVRCQDWPVDEAIVVDDGSTDGTRAVIEAYRAHHPDLPVRLVASAGRGIPAALNTGVEEARGAVVIRLDAHSCPAPDYVRRALAALVETGAGVVGGVWDIVPGRSTNVGEAIARAVSHPLGAGDAAYRVGRGLTERATVDTVPFGCFHKDLWYRLGRFNEGLLTNEDYEFNYRVREIGRAVVLDPLIRSTYQARPTLRALARQYFRYGWWKAQMLKLFPRSIRMRQAVPVAFLAAQLGLGVAAVFIAEARALFLLLVAVYLATVLAVSIAISWRGRCWAALPALLLAFAIIHYGWGAGAVINLGSGGRWPRWNVVAAGHPRVPAS